MARKKSIENTILILLFIFASIGAYVAFAGSNNHQSEERDGRATLYVNQKDFTKFNTVKPKLGTKKTQDVVD